MLSISLGTRTKSSGADELRRAVLLVFVEPPPTAELANYKGRKQARSEPALEALAKTTHKLLTLTG